jgi:hypothetical protein
MADKAELQVSSKERVAYDLMIFISNEESDNDKGVYLKPDARSYYLSLYRQCVRAAILGYDLDTTSHKEGK